MPKSSYYGSFDGQALQNVTRGPQLGQAGGAASSGIKLPPNLAQGNGGVAGGFLASTSHVVARVSLREGQNGPTWPATPGTFVFPISVRASSGARLDSIFPVPVTAGNRVTSELVQIDTDFTNQNADSTTEWIRYNASCRRHVREGRSGELAPCVAFPGRRGILLQLEGELLGDGERRALRRRGPRACPRNQLMRS